MEKYDSWKLANGQDNDKKTYGDCKYCEQPMYHGDNVTETSKGTVHEHCFEYFVDDLLNPQGKTLGE